MPKKYDFSGWATRANVKCSDGRTILKDAFKDCDGLVVPLVWNHRHDGADNVLGHALLENRTEGVYTYCTFNETESGKNAKLLVNHGDIVSLSIYANQLKQNGGFVQHGVIREVSLVLAGANPEAKIDACIVHGEESDESAYIYFMEGLELYHADEAKEEKTAQPEKKEEEKMAEKMAEKELTVQEVFDGFTDVQKNVVYALIGEALSQAGVSGKDDAEEDEKMKHNVFDGNDEYRGDVLSHSEMEAIFSDAKKCGSLKDAFIAHGIENIEYLFPEDKMVNGNAPEWIKPQDEWVAEVMKGVHHTPFSRIKSMFADITEADARAKGYVKGHRKFEEVFGLLKRTTSPTTIYKKQKLDRDDVIDINDFDVVGWLKGEMRMMLDSEIALAILLGDGRSIASEDKINEQNIRPIWTDDDLFTIKKTVALASNVTDDQRAKAFIRACIKARKDYRGSGNPILFTTEDMLTDMLLMEDTTGRVIYDTMDKLATALRVRKIVTVPPMEGKTRTDEGGQVTKLMGILVNLNDYNVGADKGGAVNMFDDFDIDYNQQKYLIETRCSGAMIKPYSAIAIESIETAYFEMEGDDPTDTVLGKAVSTVQDNIVVNDNFIQGTLKYVSGWTGYSQDPAENSGNFLVTKFDAPEGATVKVLLTGSPVGEQTLDEDMILVSRIYDKRAQKLKVTATVGGVSTSKTYSLTSLNLEKA